MEKQDVIKALEELKKNEKRKFSQSVDLIINLQKFDIKRENVNLTLNVPNSISEKKVCAFLEKKSSLVDTVTKEQFDSYKDKKKLKNLTKGYDFFIANIKLMPVIATTFERVLGPLGKMPSPQLGILNDESENSIKAMLKKIETVLKIKTKEPSIKISIGKESMDDEKIAANVLFVYNAVLNALPKKIEQIKNVMIKYTMTPAIKLKFK